jgi:NAD(P)-dependent dehydrogenase (short-subunit alcohol dehydrogenase family)
VPIIIQTKETAVSRIIKFAKAGGPDVLEFIEAQVPAPGPGEATCSTPRTALRCCRVLEKVGRLDILHANAGTYLGGDLVPADNGAIDRMLNLNVNVVMKNVHDVLPHMIERQTGNIK